MTPESQPIVGSHHPAISKPRVVFLGRRNPFNLGIIDWLAENFEIAGAYLVEPDRASLNARWRRVRNRIRKYGLLKALDELAFHVWFRFFDRDRNISSIKAHIPDRFQKLTSCTYPHWDVSDPHAPEWIEKLKSLKPDFVYVVCCSVILRKAFYEIPRLGTFVLHEGVSPEYRGLHTPLWALVEGNAAGIGYSLIHVDSSIDGGPIIAQARVKFDVTNPRLWSYLGHAALVAGIPEMEDALKRLTVTGAYEPVSTEGRVSRYYTWMGLSTYLTCLIFGPMPTRGEKDMPARGKLTRGVGG